MNQNKESYAQMKKRHQEEVNDFPMIFAFNGNQFREGMAKLGLRPDETEKIVSIGAGGYIRKSDADALKALFRRQKREKAEAMAADKDGSGYLYQMFRAELSNHEYGYTRDAESALEALGITWEQLEQDGRMAHVFLSACKDEGAWYDAHCG